MFISSGISIAEQTYQKLEELIVLTELKPRVMYTEKELANLVGCGRTPVREALQRLAVEGLVKVVQRRGVMITDVDAEKQLNLLKVRRPIQNFSSQYAAKNANDDDRKKLLKIIVELKEVRKEIPLSRASILSLLRKAHDFLMYVSHNEFVIKTMRIVHGLSRRFWIYHLKPEDIIPTLDLYIQLLDDVAHQRVDQSVVSSNKIIDYLEEFAKRTIRWK